MPTCIIGAHYKGGVIIAADRRVTRQFKFREEPKLFLVLNGQIGVGFSGKIGVIDEFRRRLDENSVFARARTIYEAIEAMSEIVAGICSAYFKRGTFHEDENVFEAVVCGLDRLNTGNPRLFRLDEKGYSERIPETSDEPYYAAGHATDFAGSLMKLFYRTDISEEETIEMACHVILQTQLMDSTVGGKPQVVILEPDKPPQLLDENRIQEIVTKVAGYTSTLVSRKLAEVLRESYKKEAHKVFEEYLVEGLVGITRNNRRFIITLEHYDKLGPRLILGKTVASYDAQNDSHETMELFSGEGEPGVLLKGTVTIPAPLVANLPTDPTEIWDLVDVSDSKGTGFRIDEEDRSPMKTVEWGNPQNRSRGVSLSVSYHELVEPGKIKHVTFSNKCVYDGHDYIVRKFMGYGSGIEVIINKPRDLQVHVVWLLTAVGKSIATKIHKPEEGPESYVQKVDGVIVPGNGFIVIWYPKM